jgi:hypothetical protein
MMGPCSAAGRISNRPVSRDGSSSSQPAISQHLSVSISTNPGIKEASKGTPTRSLNTVFRAMPATFED